MSDIPPAPVQLCASHYLRGQSGQSYRPLYLLGYGGTAIVFAAREVNSGRKIAIKQWHKQAPYRQGKLSDLRLYTTETSICAQLQHRHLVPLLDKGTSPSGDYFAVYPCLSGITLQNFLRSNASLSRFDSVLVLTQLLQALAYLHSLGIAHGDVKPQNIMLEERKNVALASTAMRKSKPRLHLTLFDFGNAFCFTRTHGVDELLELATPPERKFLCTPGYSAPEQIRGMPANPQIDLYAWGLIFLECLTGQKAVRGASLAEICRQQMSTAQILMPSALANHPLGQLLKTVLHKNPKHREFDTWRVLRQLQKITLGELANLRPES